MIKENNPQDILAKSAVTGADTSLSQRTTNGNSTAETKNKDENNGRTSEDATTPSMDGIVAGGSPPGNPPTKSTPTPDPFDPASLRLTQDFGATLGVKKALMTVPVRKPAKEWWVRVHSDPEYCLETFVLELKEDRETYLVDPSLWGDLSTESTVSPRALFTAVNTQGIVFIWPVRLPGPDGKIDEWSRSALDAACLAKPGWVRVQANMSLGAYEVMTSVNEKAPAWAAVPFKDLLRIAFKDRYIASLDHPVIKKLRGVT